jgi:hypothetical protein
VAQADAVMEQRRAGGGIDEQGDGEVTMRGASTGEAGSEHRRAGSAQGQWVGSARVNERMWGGRELGRLGTDSVGWCTDGGPRWSR